MALTVAVTSFHAHAGGGLVAKALRAMEADQWKKARELVIESGDPLARKLYLWMYLEQDKGDLNFAPLAKFLKNNPGWPGMDAFREKAEKTMPGSLSSAETIAWFGAYPPLTAAGLDRYLDALLVAGQREQAKSIASEWWAGKLSTRDEQKAIYYKYGQLLDMNAHRRRLDTLLFSEQYTNARAIAPILGKGYAELVEARIALAEEKPNVTSLLHKVPASLQNDPGLLFERLRWRRRNDLDMEAIRILHNPPPLDQIQNPDDWWKETNILIRRMLEKRRYESAYLLASRHFQKEGSSFAEAEWTAGWLALRFMKQPTKAYQRFEAMYAKVETPISKARAAYWAGRAAEEIGDKELSTSWYQNAAKFQTAFYGQLAGAKLGMAQALPNAAPPVLTAEDLRAFDRSEIIRAARFFHEAGMKDEATMFLSSFVENENTPKAYRYAAELAGDIGERRAALKIAKDATKQGMFLTAQAYPVITDSLRRVNTEWALAHAIIRQESMFDTTAVSPAGALGLMQLMPATAKHVAKKSGVAHSVSALTSNPAHNIRLGCDYMDELLERYDGSYPLAIAAYNAGPGNVSKWLKIYGDPRAGEISLIDWIEMIPLYETRNYVQRVLESVYIYRLRLKGIQPGAHAPIHIAMGNRP